MLFPVRAWDIVRKKMLYWGVDFHYLTPKGICVFNSQSMKNGTSHKNSVIPLYGSLVKDKNNQGIYAGDVLKFDQFLGIVYFSDEFSSFRIKVYKGTEFVTDDYLNLYHEKSSVAGHIFQDEFKGIFVQHISLFQNQFETEQSFA